MVGDQREGKGKARGARVITPHCVIGEFSRLWTVLSDCCFSDPRRRRPVRRGQFFVRCVLCANTITKVQPRKSYRYSYNPRSLATGTVLAEGGPGRRGIWLALPGARCQPWSPRPGSLRATEEALLLSWRR